MAKPPHIALFSHCGFGNFGNDATLELVLNHLRRRLPQAQFTCIVVDPEAVARDLGVAALAMYPEPRFPPRPGPAPLRLLRRLANEAVRVADAFAIMGGVDYLVVPGGGRFDDFNSRASEAPYWLWKWTQLARLRGAPFELFCIGAGPVDFALSRWFYRRVARAASRRSFRDEESRQYVAQTLGVDTAGDELTDDLVFAIATPGEPAPPQAPVKTVGIGVMEYNNRRGTKGGPDDRYFAYLENLTAFALKLLARGHDLKILIGETCDMSAARDLDGRLRAAAPERAAQISICPANNIHDVMAAIAGCDAVAATRFHNVVAALRMGRPVLSLGYASKNLRVMEQFGLEAYCQTIETCDADRLLAQFDALCANAGALAPRIRAQAGVLQRKMELRLDELAERIRRAAPQAGAPAKHAEPAA